MWKFGWGEWRNVLPVKNNRLRSLGTFYRMIRPRHDLVKVTFVQA